MVKGKSTCKTLKAIRQQIAQANDIEYEPRECHYEGPCQGTCPACEAEVRYLESQLSRRRMLGRAISLLGVSAGLLSACAQIPTNVDMQRPVLTGDVDNVELWKSSDMAVQGKSTALDIQAIDSIRPMKKDESVVFGEIVEQMPSFPGGHAKLMEYLSENIHYPDSTGETCVQGRVVVSFVVERDGSITEAKVVKSLLPAFDAVALRVVSGMPKWVPGKRNGESIRMKFAVPIVFKVKSGE